MNYIKLLFTFFLVVNLSSFGFSQVDKAVKKAIKYSNKADIQLEKGKFDKSIALYTKSIELQSKKAIYYYRRGIAYHTKKNYQKAFADFDKTVQLDTASKKGYYQRGLMQLKLKNYNEALADFELHKGINGANAEGATQSGRAAMALKEYDRALIFLENAAELKANDPEIYQLKAEIYMILEDYTAAEKEIAVIRTLNGGNSKIDLMEARCALALGNSKKAKTILKKIVANNPSAPSYKLLAQTFENADSAILYINKAITIDPAAEYYKDLGNYTAQKGLTTEAKTHFNKAISLDPALAEAYSGRGYYVYFKEADYDNALADLNTAISLNQTDANSYAYRSLIHFKLGNLDGAFSDAAKSFNISDTEFIFRNLAIYYQSLGEIEMNELMLKKALEIQFSK